MEKQDLLVVPKLVDVINEKPVPSDDQVNNQALPPYLAAWHAATARKEIACPQRKCGQYVSNVVVGEPIKLPRLVTNLAEQEAEPSPNQPLVPPRLFD